MKKRFVSKKGIIKIHTADIKKKFFTGILIIAKQQLMTEVVLFSTK